MKKTSLAIALLASISSVQAAHYDLAGMFEMRAPDGMLMESNYPVTGSLELDITTGSGSIDMDIINPYAGLFWGQFWTAHDVSLQLTSPSFASFEMLFDWGPTTNIYVTMDMGVTINEDGSIDFITLDGPSADGIPGNPMDNGPFPGFNAALNMTATSIVPVPASVWLFGSGLLGLIGVGKRKTKKLLYI